MLANVHVAKLPLPFDKRILARSMLDDVQKVADERKGRGPWWKTASLVVEVVEH